MENCSHTEMTTCTQPVENIVKAEGEILYTTSLILAKAFEKEHKNVLQAISNLECSENFHRLNFQLVEYADAKGELRPAYVLTRDGFAFLAMGFTGKKAAVWKERFLDAFNVMEAELVRRQSSEVEDGQAEEVLEAQAVTDVQPSLCKFFYPRKKASKRQLEDMEALLRFESVIQREDVEDTTRRLCQRLGVSTLQDLSASRVNEALHAIVSFLFDVRKVQEPKILTPDFLCKTLHSLIGFWNRADPEYTKSAVRNYVCNRCNIENIDSLKTAHELFIAIIALWGGINNHVFRTKCW